MKVYLSKILTDIVGGPNNLYDFMCQFLIYMYIQVLLFSFCFVWTMYHYKKKEKNVPIGKKRIVLLSILFSFFRLFTLLVIMLLMEDIPSTVDFSHGDFFQIQGLEKYVMTKLFTRVFASLPDDVKHDEQLSEKMALIQQFIRPENLDIKPNFQNETSWLVSKVDFFFCFFFLCCL